MSVTYSADLPYPSWHLDPECGGLEKVESERRGTRGFADAQALADDTDGRICRMCTLESLLRTILRREHDEPVRYVTFSSVPPRHSERRVPARTTVHGASESGEARLRRVAKTLGLETTPTPSSGLVAHGAVPVRALEALGTNLDTLTLPWVRRTPGSEHIQCFWILVDDQPGPLDTALRRDLWTTARLLTR